MRKFIMDKYNLIAFAIGLIPTILLYLFPPDAAVPFWAFSIVLFFLLIAIWMCAKLWLESKNDKAVPTISIIECSHNVCICKTHDFITYNSIVTFYKKDGNFEKLIGFGLVETAAEKPHRFGSFPVTCGTRTKSPLRKFPILSLILMTIKITLLCALL